MEPVRHYSILLNRFVSGADWSRQDTVEYRHIVSWACWDNTCNDGSSGFLFILDLRFSRTPQPPLMTTFSVVSDRSHQTESTSTRTLPPSVRTAWSTEQKLLQVTLISRCLFTATSLFLLYLEDPEDATLTSNIKNNKAVSLTLGWFQKAQQQSCWSKRNEKFLNRLWINVRFLQRITHFCLEVD